MLMAGSSERPASSGCIQELSLCLGALNSHEYGSPLLLLQPEVIGCGTDTQMVSTGVGKMNLQGAEAGMRSEKQLWSGKRGIRATPLGRKKRQEPKCTNRKPVTITL